jgi:hypothetical protein
MTMTWEERLRASEAVVAEHKRLIDTMKASIRGEDNALRVESKLPYFVSMSDDPFSSDIVIYPFKVGSSHEHMVASLFDRRDTHSLATRHAIRSPISSLWARVSMSNTAMFSIASSWMRMDKRMCLVASQSFSENESLREIVTFHPIADLCFVNEEPITIGEPRQLVHGDHVRLGEANYYRFVHPTEALKMRKARENSAMSSCLLISSDVTSS